MISKNIKLFLKLLFTAALCAATFFLYRERYSLLPRANYLTGWLLFGVMMLLAVYNGRKKIPFLPAGNSKSWLQFHIYAGFFTALLFLLHVHFRPPTGWFENILAVLYWIVMVSGIAGLFISRSFPKRLTSRGGEVIYELIPVARRELREQAEALALQSISDAQASTVADFYLRELAGFFSGPKNFWAHVFEMRGPLNDILKKAADLNRFLNEKERGVMAQMALLIRQKDGLDYHRALQLTLKLWLFVHIPLTYSLLIFSVVHLVLVYAFSGGVR